MDMSADRYDADTYTNLSYKHLLQFTHSHVVNLPKRGVY